MKANMERVKRLLIEADKYRRSLNALYDDLEGHVTENPLKLALSCHMACIQECMTELSKDKHSQQKRANLLTSEDNYE